MADINKIKLGDTQYELGATKIKTESSYGSSNDSVYELSGTPPYTRDTSGTYQKVYTHPNIRMYPNANAFDHPLSGKHFEGGPTVVIGSARLADCFYEYDNGWWDDEAGEWVESWSTEFDTSCAGTGHLEVAGNLLVGGSSDDYGIFPYQDNYSKIGDESHKWCEIHGTSIYENGQSLTNKYQKIGTVHSTNTSSKIYLVGTTTQGPSKTAYSHDTAYVGIDGCLYSGGAKVLTSQTIAYNYVGDADAKSNAATTNGNTYLKLYEGRTKRSQFKISGSGAASVASDASGNITISSIDTKNTAGSTNSTSTLYLVGATSQAANPQTYSNSAVYATNGTLTATAFSGNGATLTALNADNISSGTLAKERLPKQPLQVIRCDNVSTNNYKYHRFACVGTKANPITDVYADADVLLFIRQTFDNGAHGILKLSLRTNGPGQQSSCSAKWLLRNGFSQEAVKIGLVATSGATFADIFIEMPSLWGRIEMIPIEGPDSFALMETYECDNTTASDKLDSYNVFSSLESACVELHGTGSSYTHFGASYDAPVNLGDVTAYSFTGNGSNLTNISYNKTNFVYPYPGSFDANSSQACSEGHYFLIHGVNTPTSHGFLDISYFDGAGFDPCGLGHPMGVVRQHWLDWQTGYEWTRTYSDGTGWSIWNKIVTADTNGNVSAVSFTATSDRRLKENIESYVCDKSILDLDVKKFDFINGKKGQIGCIAQDLQEICPELVKEGEDGYLSIHESKLVYLLLQELKKQNNDIKELKAKLQEV